MHLVSGKGEGSCVPQLLKNQDKNGEKKMKMNQNVIKAVVCTMLVAFFFAVSMPVAFAATAKVKEHTVKGILEPYKGALVLITGSYS